MLSTGRSESAQFSANAKNPPHKRFTVWLDSREGILDRLFQNNYAGHEREISVCISGQFHRPEYLTRRMPGQETS